MMEMLLYAFSVGLLISVPPGAITMATLQCTFARGFWNALVFNLGIMAVDCVYLLGVYFGLHALMTGNDLVRLALLLLSGAWMGWLGLEAVRQPPSTAFGAEQTRYSSYRQSFRNGFVMNLFNPLTLVGWASLTGHFFATWHRNWPPLNPFGLVAIGLMLVGVIAWQVMLILVMNSARRLVNLPLLRALSFGGGLLLILYGVGTWYAAFELVMRWVSDVQF